MKDLAGFLNVWPLRKLVVSSLPWQNGLPSLPLSGLMVIDREVPYASCMNLKKLCAFFEKTFEECKKQDILLSLHLKATMMKVSNPSGSAIASRPSSRTWSSR